MQSSQNLNKENNLASQEYWDQAYADYALTRLGPNDKIKLWIEKYIPKNEAGSCIEIGCFPGRFLTVFGDLGYQLNGLDLTPRIENEFPQWLKSLDYKTGTFQKIDFFKFDSSQQFNVVASFGFMEHFKNWEDVFVRHLDRVKKGGYIVMETPNFKGWFQRLIHLVLDRKNYNRHNISAMNPAKWAKIAEEKGFEIVFEGYIGEFEFWIDEAPTTWFKQKLLNQLIKNYDKLRAMKPAQKAYSPYCGLIAKRK